MRLVATPLAGAYVIELEPLVDGRGSFTRTFDAELFADHGLEPRVAQCSTSFNAVAGTLRGMHFQAVPHSEAKLVRVTSGAIYDVIVDLRSESATFRSWFGIELSSSGRQALFVPTGLAHGFQTLCDASAIDYQISHPYVPDAARGVRFDDPAFGIRWPAPPPGGLIISDRDRSFPDFTTR
jgi:dTDP-4-dehydrorhamnose 3,5-epimerase